MTPLAMKRKAPKPHTQAPASAALQRQRGLTLLESLAALVVLALGILGLLAAQTRMLVETRTTNSRATAIRQIVDLGERIKLNRAAALADNYNVENLEAAPAPRLPSATKPKAAPPKWLNATHGNGAIPSKAHYQKGAAASPAQVPPPIATSYASS